MQTRAFLLAAAALILSGCYASHRLLLDASAAAHPIEDGVYVRQGDQPDKLRITLDPDGWYEVETFNANGTIGETHRVLAVETELDGRGGYALAEASSDGYEYGVAFLIDKRLYLRAPDCSDPLDRDAALEHGAETDDSEAMTHDCFFKTHDDLIDALSDFAGNAGLGAPYERVGQ